MTQHFLPYNPSLEETFAAVDEFAREMKWKLHKSQLKGRSGWDDPSSCSTDDLSRNLRHHVEKGDPIDVANFCMMLHHRGSHIGR